MEETKGFEHKEKFNQLAKNFSHMAYINTAQKSDSDGESSDSDKPPKRIRGIRQSQREEKMKLRKKKKTEEN